MDNNTYQIESKYSALTTMCWGVITVQFTFINHYAVFIVRNILTFTK